MTTVTAVPYTLESGSSENAHIPDIRICVNCGTRCKDDVEVWYSECADIGPDRKWYCSQSCRNNAMFQQIDPVQQQAMLALVRMDDMLSACARRLGLVYDHDLKTWQLPAGHPMEAWNFHYMALLDFLEHGQRFSAAIYTEAAGICVSGGAAMSSPQLSIASLRKRDDLYNQIPREVIPIDGKMHSGGIFAALGISAMTFFVLSLMAWIVIEIWKAVP
jgi:hypothetical protein